jgi:lysozyme
MSEAKRLLVELIKEAEGCKLKAYRCPAHVLTIGYGQTKGVKEGMVWTQEQAEADLQVTAQEVLERALKASPTLNDASPERQAAIADFIYNCGERNYKKSTLKKYVDQELWEHARMEIVKWNQGGGHVLPGLVKRRAKEAALLKS